VPIFGLIWSILGICKIIPIWYNFLLKYKNILISLKVKI